VKKKKMIIVIIILFVLGGVAALAWESIIYVSPIKGKVVDAETGKPMEGVNVRAGWVTGYAEPGGGVYKTFKVYATKTDANGEFVLPRIIKLKIPIIERYQGINVLIYEHGYSGFYKDIVGNALYLASHKYIQKVYINFIDIKLPSLKNDEEFNNNLRKIYSKLFYELPSKTNKYDDFKFTIDEINIFLEEYPDSHFLEDTYWILAGVYRVEMGERENYESAIKWSEEFIKKYPNAPAPVIGRVKEDIERFKKLLRQSK